MKPTTIHVESTGETLCGRRAVLGRDFPLALAKESPTIATCKTCRMATQMILKKFRSGRY